MSTTSCPQCGSGPLAPLPDAGTLTCQACGRPISAPTQVDVILPKPTSAKSLPPANWCDVIHGLDLIQAGSAFLTAIFVLAVLGIAFRIGVNFVTSPLFLVGTMVIGFGLIIFGMAHCVGVTPRFAAKVHLILALILLIFGLIILAWGSIYRWLESMKPGPFSSAKPVFVTTTMLSCVFTMVSGLFYLRFQVALARMLDETDLEGNCQMLFMFGWVMIISWAAGVFVTVHRSRISIGAGRPLR